MIVLVQAASMATIIAIGIALMGRSRTTIGRTTAVGLSTNVLTLYYFLFLRKFIEVYGGSLSWGFVLEYIAISVGIAAVVLVALKLAYDRGILAPSETRKRWRSVTAIIVGAVLGFLIGLFFFVPMWFGKTFGTIPADHFIFLLTQGNGESTREQDLAVRNLMFVPVFASAVLGACLGSISTDIVRRRRVAHKRRFHHLRAATLVTMCLVLVCSVTYAFKTVPLEGVFRQRFMHSEYIAEHFVPVTKDNVKLPAKKRNLIHIYMESVENSFYSREKGGYMQESLMPELEKMTETGVSFSNTDTFGGPEQVYASGHSIAAMVNMSAGVPMLSSGAGDGTQMSYPNFTTIGDILHENGYNNEFMLGASAKWGGLGDYYRRHGKFKVFDHKYAQDQGLIPKDYHEWWGFEDDKLYEFAKSELTALSKSDKPFYFVLENADTHFPDGYESKNMKEKPYEKQYANVIRYSQAEVVKMIQWIQAQPWAADTSIVVTGDHRSMDKGFFHKWDPKYNRTIVNFILNPVQGTDQPRKLTHNRTFAPFDFFPTILSSIGAEIKGHRLGLGTDLFSGEPTLLERAGDDGVAKLNAEFSLNSKFYDEHRETRATNPDKSQDEK